MTNQHLPNVQGAEYQPKTWGFSRPVLHRLSNLGRAVARGERRSFGPHFAGTCTIRVVLPGDRLAQHINRLQPIAGGNSYAVCALPTITQSHAGFAPSAAAVPSPYGPPAGDIRRRPVPP